MKNYRKPFRVRRKKHPLRFFKNQVFWFNILIVLFLSGVFYVVVFYKNFQIKEIKVSGNEKVLTADILSIVNSEINKKIVFFNSKSIFLSKIGKIKEDLLEKFPQISEIDIKKNFPDILSLTIQERNSFGIWCVQQEEVCFNLDSNGIIFSENTEQDQKLKIVNSYQENSQKLGEKVINKELLDSIKILNLKLKELKIPILKFILENTERINIKTNEGWFIYLNSQDDWVWQITRLSQILEKEIPLGERGNLEYIDLRFTKVYIK